MRLPVESGRRLKRMANRHGWTPSDASARLVEEGLRRAEFAFIDFRESAAGRQACIQGSTLAVWEIMLLIRGYKANVSAVAKHLRWPPAKVQAAVHYAEAFPQEINEAIAENDSTDFGTLKRKCRRLPNSLPGPGKPRNAEVPRSFFLMDTSRRTWQSGCAAAIGGSLFTRWRSGRMATFSGRTTPLF